MVNKKATDTLLQYRIRFPAKIDIRQIGNQNPINSINITEKRHRTVRRAKVRSFSVLSFCPRLSRIQSFAIFSLSLFPRFHSQNCNEAKWIFSSPPRKCFCATMTALSRRKLEDPLKGCESLRFDLRCSSVGFSLRRRMREKREGGTPCALLFGKKTR